MSAGINTEDISFANVRISCFEAVGKFNYFKVSVVGILVFPKVSEMFIQAEKKLMREYGLKNKKELWRLNSQLKNIKRRNAIISIAMM